MTVIEREDDLIIGQEYRITDGPAEDQVGVCRKIHTSVFGYVWGEIELPNGTQRVRWNLLAIHPEPPKAEITTRVGVWVCPTCGEQGQFAGFCDADHGSNSARFVYRTCLTVEQIERARNEYIEGAPETSRTIDAFLKKVFDTPLLASE